MRRESVYLFGGLALLAWAGCQSDNRGAARGGGTGGAPMTASGELAIANPNPMDAQSEFLSGALQAEIMFAKSDAPWKTASAGDNSGSRGRGGFGGGFGGGRGRRGGQRGGDDSPRPDAESGAMRGPAVRASNAPPVQLRLRLTNRSNGPIEVEVLDFNSDLGNFVVQPSKLTVPANGSAEPDPMTSRLGVPAVGEIPVTVRLRMGGTDGRSETQVLKLRPRAGESVPAPAAEPPR